LNIFCTSQKGKRDLKSKIFFEYKNCFLNLFLTTFRIIIFIRGAPGSGKTWLANLILEKEAEVGNRNRMKFITPNRYYLKKFVRELGEKYLQNLLAEVKDVVDEGFYNFVVVEYEGADQTIFTKMTEHATKVGGFEFYIIDILQEFEVCMSYLIHSRAYLDVEEICNKMKRESAQNWNNVIDPVEIVAPGWRANRVPTPEPPKVVTKPKYDKRREHTGMSRVSRFDRYDSYDDDDDEECFS
jgi:hypothetical protein